MLLCCPFYFHIHDYPSDYWRFSPAAMEVLMDGLPQRIIGWQGPTRRPANVWGLGFRDGAKPVTQDQFDRYAALLRQYARQPLRVSRVVRYNLARLLVGRGPFAAYLDQSKWGLEFHGGSSNGNPLYTVGG